MARSKKVLSLILAVVMVLGVFAVNAFAATETGTFTVTAAPTSVSNGDTITVTVTATTDFYAGPMSIPVTYDSTNFSLVAGSVTVSDVFGASATDKVINTNTAGLVRVLITPKTSATPVAPKMSSTTVFTFQLTATGSTGSYDIAVKDDQKTSTNVNGTFYCGSFSTSDPKTATLTTMGQTLNRVASTVTYAAAATPVLQVADGVTGVYIDRTSTHTGFAGFVYGIPTDAGTTILSQLKTPAGSISVTNNSNSQASTGATIELKNAQGTTIETYYFIFFGDVNGDGYVDATDVSSVDGVAGYIDSSYAAGDASREGMAADINGDGFIDATDVSAIDSLAGYVTSTTQAEFAATVATAKGLS